MSSYGRVVCVRESLHWNKILTKTEVGTKDLGIVGIGLTMVWVGGM